MMGQLLLCLRGMSDSWEYEHTHGCAEFLDFLEEICVHRICYSKPDLKSVKMTPPKSVRIISLGLAPSCVLAL